MRGFWRNRRYKFAEKLKLVFKKMLALFDLGDPLVQIHVGHKWFFWFW